MNIGNKYIVAIIAAAATGLPQGINASPLQGMAEVIPADTVYIITAFGLIGGVQMAFGLIKERLKNKYFPSKYKGKHRGQVFILDIYWPVSYKDLAHLQ